ncbi:MAG: hypothetical protein R3C19_11880 [Planctomycetaceae bacterium]
MNASRREKLQSMLADDPDDQMLRYMLATELDRDGDHDESLTLYRSLMDDSSPYVPAFLMAGQQLARLGRIDDARATYQRGITEANRTGDEHAAGEMAEFLRELRHA